MERMIELRTRCVVYKEVVAGGYTFRVLREKGENYRKVIVSTETDETRVLVDPNKSGGKGKIIEIFPSPAGDHLAYSFHKEGDPSDRWSISVVNDWGVESPIDTIPGRVRTPYCYQVCWCPDGESFLYLGSTTMESLKSLVIYRHRLGTTWEEDEVFLDPGDPTSSHDDLAFSDDGAMFTAKLDIYTPERSTFAISWLWQDPGAVPVVQGEVAPPVTPDHNQFQAEVFTSGMPGSEQERSEYITWQENYETVACLKHAQSEWPVPVSLCARGEVTEPRPTLLVAGGFRGTVFPTRFRADYFPFVEAGGLLAFACVRGGGELGRDWHEAGKRRNKIFGAVDLVSVAEHLVKSGLADPKRLALTGESVGGLLAAMAGTCYPGTFKAVICQSGLYDMQQADQCQNYDHLREEIIDLSDDEDLLLSRHTNPILRVSEETTANTDWLITAGTADDRVPPSQARRFVAELQQKRAAFAKGRAFLDLYFGAGHNGSDNMYLLAGDDARMLTFLFESLRMEPRR